MSIRSKDLKGPCDNAATRQTCAGFHFRILRFPRPFCVRVKSGVLKVLHIIASWEPVVAMPFAPVQEVVIWRPRSSSKVACASRARPAPSTSP